MKISKYKMSFGWDGDDGIGEMLIKQIIDGIKTATCGFKILYTNEDIIETNESKGHIVTVLDHNDNPRCNIRIIDVFETTFGNPDLRLVKGEGDGDDVQKFKEDHRIAWENTVNEPITDDAILVVQLFELVEVNDNAREC